MYDAGRYLVGPFSYFVKFPGSLQTIEFSNQISVNPPLKTRTEEGLSLTLYLSFQYLIIKKDVPLLFSMNSLLYEQTFTRIARDTIL